MKYYEKLKYFRPIVFVISSFYGCGRLAQSCFCSGSGGQLHLRVHHEPVHQEPREHSRSERAEHRQGSPQPKCSHRTGKYIKVLNQRYNLFYYQMLSDVLY